MAIVVERETVATDKAPAAVGPYSQAIRAGEFIFTAGQVGLDPRVGRLVPGDVEEQARQALSNLAAILEEAGSSLDKVVKTTVFLTDIRTYARVNAVYAEFFRESPPARSAVQVAALPLGASIEIEAVAVR